MGGTGFVFVPPSPWSGIPHPGVGPGRCEAPASPGRVNPGWYCGPDSLICRTIWSERIKFRSRAV